MKIRKVNTWLIVISGYCLLVILAIFGVVTVYLEMLKSLKISEHPAPKQEMTELNRTLAIMYQAEGTAGLISVVSDEKLMKKYDSLTITVFRQIESMKSISDDAQMLVNLDSLSFLIEKKQKNAKELLYLINDIENNTVKEITQTTISAWGDIDKLSKSLVNKIKMTEDTTKIISEKKGFFKRIKEAVKPSQDSLIQVSKNSVSDVEEIVIPIITDTLTEFIQEVNQVVLHKNANIVRQMIARQNKLYQINELTGARIQQIMDNIQNLEYQSTLEALNAKGKLQKKSTIFVSGIALAAMIIAIFFMTWTLKSLNKSQKLHKDIQNAKKRVEKLLVSREQLIYSITHDIKTPVSSIMGFLELMLDDKPSQKQLYYIDNMNFSASHILDLVKNLLDFQSLEKNQPQLNEMSFSPFLLLKDIYQSFLPLAGNKKIRFELHQTIKEENKYQGDPYRIRKILNNLISNALKFTPENGKICVSVSIDSGNTFRVSVKDNGPGIGENDKTRIFEEFTRLEDTKLNVEGAGLGLTISKRLVQILGGNIELKSQLGQGSDFILTLPLIPISDRTPIVNPVKKETTRTPLTENIRVLFVDDDMMHLNLFSELMKKEDLSFKCCASSLEALKILLEESFNIIFTDIQLPDINGDELAGQIRKLSFPGAAEIPIIAFSADSQWLENNAKSEFTGFLPKPFKAWELLETIEKYTGQQIQPIVKYPKQLGSHFDNLLEFVSGDQKLALNILDSFKEETQKNLDILKMAFDKDDKETIKKLSHKMGSLMKMISANEVVSLLNDFEKGSQSEEKAVTLFRLINEKIEEAEDIRKNFASIKHTS
jgi:signal transduction histidine kinase/CheY-like chemotaxis protein